MLTKRFVIKKSNNNKICRGYEHTIRLRQNYAKMYHYSIIKAFATNCSYNVFISTSYAKYMDNNSALTCTIYLQNRIGINIAFIVFICSLFTDSVSLLLSNLSIKFNFLKDAFITYNPTGKS